MINDILIYVNDWINSISGQNQVIAGAIVLWVLGVSSYLLKVVPSKVLGFTKKHLTTELTVTNDSAAFYKVCDWIGEKSFCKGLRKLKLNNGRHGCDTSTKSIGYGNHILFHNYRPISINLSMSDNSNSEKFKEVLQITTLGRSHKYFNRLISDITQLEDTKRSYTYTKDGYWHRHKEQTRRDFSNVILEDDKEQIIKSTINSFLNKEEWYKINGIPYQLGILLYGPPGTGKTSVIKAIANYVDRNIAILPVNNIQNLEHAFNNMPDDSIIVLEDIDTNIITRSRDKSTEEHSHLLDILEAEGTLLSHVLNTIDGLVSQHGRILIMTTNHIDKLDKALIRPGRVDLKVEVSYLNSNTFYKFMKRFFGNVPQNFKILDNNLTAAKLQEEVLSGNNWEQIYEKYTVLGKDV